MVTMSDGIRLAADLWMPDSQGKFPCVLNYQPYHKDDVGSSVFPTLPQLFVERGYCYALVDVRGTGASEGTCSEMHSEREQKDGFEVVEWLASQGWSNGRVGMLGWAYGSASSLLVASLAPPHLKAVVPMFGGAGNKPSWRDGSLSAFYHAGYVGAMMAAMNAMPPTYRDGEGRWFEMWKQRLEQNVPWVFSYFEEKDRVPSSDLTGITIPTFIISSWYDLEMPAAADLYSALRSPKKLIIGPWLQQEPDSSVLGPRLDYRTLLLGWFDRWLKGGEAGGTMAAAEEEEDPVLVYAAEFTPPDALREGKNPWVMGTWRRYKDWPPQSTPTVFYLDALHHLGADLPSSDGGMHYFAYDPRKGTLSGLKGGVFSGCALPLDQKGDESGSAVYDTDRLERAVEIDGRPQVRLSVRSASLPAAIAVKLCDENEYGESVLVTSGYLYLARGDLGGGVEPIERHDIYGVEIAMNPVSYLFTKRHKIKLVISGADFPASWPTPTPGVVEIHCGKLHPSSLVLPVATTLAGKVHMESPPLRVERTERTIVPAGWRVSQDMRRSTLTVDWSRETELLLLLADESDGDRPSAPGHRVDERGRPRRRRPRGGLQDQGQRAGQRHQHEGPPCHPGRQVAVPCERRARGRVRRGRMLQVGLDRGIQQRATMTCGDAEAGETRGWTGPRDPHTPMNDREVAPDETP